MNNNKSYAVCFGEVLWDIFPTVSRAGGAPFNVAYNLDKMGVEVQMISKVGNDTLGNELLNQIKNWNISTDFIQIDNEKPTGTVVANFDEQGEAHYNIVNNVAWDNIRITEKQKELIQNSKAFVFGSLIARNEVSKNTLLELIELSRFRVFDVNFRPPFIDFELIKTLLHKADLVKMNKAELRTIIEFLGEEYIDEDNSIRHIQKHFDLNEIVLTKGSKGARYFVGDKSYNFPAVAIEVNDTVGSGDSFLAGFLSKRIQGKLPEEIMKQAVSLGAFITSKSGACPDYTYGEFKSFREEHYGETI
ncbi:carbohydrate kinase family protein [Chryseobacterium caseinilyticum]|uniref:Carbohydrate kinase n=1 Tax=Chryseobacterium caseinilyticum TaxID=2771428 RepID=A0ABR8Z6W1_9FLAO|nr:carbohydrate kinase [Chryseobacterium caseinilyticum]MBD8081035.1 carbohydrate kinase [Chryseobacterium caseinilyticum]